MFLALKTGGKEGDIDGGDLCERFVKGGYLGILMKGRFRTRKKSR